MPHSLPPSEGAHIEGTVPSLNLLALMQSVFRHLGIEGVGLSNLVDPEPRRTRSLFLALVNSWPRLHLRQPQYYPHHDFLTLTTTPLHLITPPQILQLQPHPPLQHTKSSRYYNYTHHSQLPNYYDYHKSVEILPIQLLFYNHHHHHNVLRHYNYNHHNSTNTVFITYMSPRTTPQIPPQKLLVQPKYYRHSD
ncbi:uncharacterized protein LOC144145955 [Haemaphysalis longicornis]